MTDVLHAVVSVTTLVMLVAVELLRAAAGTTRAVRRLQWASGVALLAFCAVVVDRLSDFLP